MSDDLGLTGRVAIVTGAAKGLGRAYAIWLAQNGCAVVVSNRLDENGSSAAQMVVDEITGTGGQAAVHNGPVESAESAHEMVRIAHQNYGRCDILVCNAGIQQWTDFADVTLDDMRRLIDVNLWGTIYGIKAIWPSMLSAGYGRIVLTGSSAGLWGQVQSAQYAASKAAMAGLARAIALDVPDGKDIHINTIAPAAYTPMSADSFGEQWAEYAAAEKVAPVVGWLASERCTTSGGIYHAGAGHIRRVQILEGPIHNLADGPIDQVMQSLERQPEWTSSFASGAELMPELAKAHTQT